MTAADGDDRLNATAEALGRRPGNFRFQHEVLFDGIDLRGSDVLDVGAGDGATSLYAACAGAASVVSLEPELAGSRSGMTSRFERAREAIGADSVELRGETLQQYDPGDRRFEVITSVSSINHLDERACMRLPDDPTARATYGAILGKLAGLAKPGAAIAVSDCARRNLFGDLHIRNPIAPTIEWEKHQSPRLWAELLGEAGFTMPRVRWLTLNSLRKPGRWVLGNRVAAYCGGSVFCLTMRRA